MLGIRGSYHAHHARLLQLPSCIYCGLDLTAHHDDQTQAFRLGAFDGQPIQSSPVIFPERARIALYARGSTRSSLEPDAQEASR